jgi:hypothetical protein
MPLEVIFRKPELKSLVFCTFGKMSEGVKEVLEIAVDYGAEHLGRCMAATVVETVRVALRRRCRTQLSTAACKYFANLLIDKKKYVGINA